MRPEPVAAVADVGRKREKEKKEKEGRRRQQPLFLFLSRMKEENKFSDFVISPEITFDIVEESLQP